MIGTNRKVSNASNAGNNFSSPFSKLGLRLFSNFLSGFKFSFFLKIYLLPNVRIVHVFLVNLFVIVNSVYMFFTASLNY
jgi:hypothetical protein